MAHSPEFLDTLSKDIDDLCAKREIDYEEFLYCQAELAFFDAANQKDAITKATLEGMAEALETAAFNYYASFK